MSTRFVLQVLLACFISAAPGVFSATNIPTAGEDEVITAPVTLDGETLFQVRGISASPAAERAANVHKRIKEVASDVSIDPDSGRLEPGENRVAVIFGGRTVVTFYTADAVVEGVELNLLADAALFRLTTAIRDFRAARSPEHLLHVSGILVLISIVGGVLFWAIFAVFRWLDNVLERRVKRNIQKLEQASHRILDASQIGGWLRGLLRALRAFALFALVLIWLDAALGLYPWTSPLAAQLFSLLLDPLKEMGLGVLAALPDMIFLAVLFVVIRFVLGVVRIFFDRVHRGWIRLANFDSELAMPTYSIVRALIIVFSLVIAYPYIPGSDSDAFKGMTIFLGVVMSIGSSSFIANIIAGYSLTYRRAFREGDRIKVGEQEGIVLEMSTLNTRIRSVKNEDINIPNSLVLGSAIVNFSTFQSDPGLILHTEVGIGYEVSWRQVEAMLLEAARRTTGLKQEPSPFVLQKSLGDFSVVYELNAYCEAATKMFLLYSALHSHIQDVFNEYGVQIMTPNYEADPPQAKVVPPAQWYVAPAAPPPA